jgi:hypothetical protein
MNNNAKRLVAIVGIGLALMMPMYRAFADTMGQLSAEWWQWALSIPTSVSPLTDTTGDNAVVGQRGSIWFLAGVSNGGTVVRNVSVPQGASLFFPVVNAINFNTPGICGQSSNDLLIADMRAASKAFIDKVTQLSATVDGIAINLNNSRVQSEVFEITLPKDNLFAPFCTDIATGGVFSPAVDDGFYVLLNPPSVGNHTVHFHAKNASQKFEEDVTYNISVKPVKLHE